MADLDKINAALNANLSYGSNAGQKDDYAYTNLSGVDLLTNQDAIKDVRDYYGGQGVTFENYTDMWDKFYSDRRWSDVNTIGGVSSVVESSLAGDDIDRLGRLSKMWANAPMRGSTLDRVYDYGKAGLLDPTNLIPYAGPAAKAKAVYQTARAGMKTVDQAKNAARLAGATNAAKQEAIIGAGIGGAQDLMKQTTEVQQGLSDGIDIGRVVGSAALDAGVSGAAGGVLELAGTSSIGRSIPGLNRVIGGEYAEDAANWEKSTTLGQTLTGRSNALNREAASVQAKIAASAPDADLGEFNERIVNINLELDEISAGARIASEMNTKLDELSVEIQTGKKNKLDTSNIEKEYTKTLGEFNNLTNQKILQLEAPKAPEAEVEPLAPEAPLTQQIEPPVPEADPLQISAPDQKLLELKVRRAADGEVIITPPPEPTPAAPEVKVVPRAKDNFAKILEDNKDIITPEEVNTLAASGELSLTKTNLVGANAIKDIKKIIANRRATPIEEVSEAIADTVNDAASEATSEAIETTADSALDFAPSANPELEDLADELMPRLMKEAAGANDDPIVAIRTKIIPSRTDISPPLKRILSQRLNSLEKERARSAGASVREVGTTEGRTPGRTADSSLKSVRAMEDLPQYVPDPTTGRMVRNPDFVEAGVGISGAIKSSKNIGGGNFATTSKGTTPKEFARTSALRMAEADAKKGIGKLFYTYTSYVGDVHADGVTKSGEGAVTAYWFPSIGKSFRNVDTALKAMETQGVKVNENYVAYDEDMVPVFTDRQYASEKQAIIDKFASKKINKEEYDAQLSRLDQRAEGAMVEPEKKEVIGREGKIIKRIKAGVPNLRGKKVIAAIPRREFDAQGNVILSKVLTNNQIKTGKSAEALLGNEDLNNWYVGYVPTNARSKTSDIDEMMKDFEPLDGSNKIGDLDRQDPTAPPAPIDLQSRGDALIIDTNTLTPEELNSLFFAYGLARNKNINLIGDLRKPDDLHQNEVTLRDLTRMESMIDNAPWEIDYNINGQTVPMNNKMRLKILRTIHGLQASIAPNGVRLPAVDIDTSLDQVNKIIIGASPTTRRNIERMMRLIVPDTLAPIFETAEMDTSVLGRYVNDRNDALNRIQLNAEAIQNGAKTQGLSETHVVAHEMGHWLYNNLMSNGDKSDFWKAIDGYYDGDGKLYKDGDRDAMRDIALRSPYFKGSAKSVGFSNALDSPAEYFANQFSLFMNHKYDLMMWPNEPFFKKTMSLVKKLWYLMSRKEILDPELEPIFDKLITRKDHQMRKQFLRPKEPSNKFSLTLMANYENLRIGKSEVTRALENADIGTFIQKIKEPEIGLESQLRRLTASENDAKAYARRKGEDYKGYTGMLEAVKQNGVGSKLKGILVRMEGLGLGRTVTKDIKQSTDGSTSEGISVKEGAEGGISATEYPIEDYIELRRLFDESLVPTVEQAMRQINDAYYRLEHGDIPTAQFDTLTLEQRAKSGMKAIEKSTQADINYKKTKQVRGRRKNMVDEAVKALQSKKTEFNEADFDGVAATEYPDLVPLIGELENVAKKVKNFKDSKAAIKIANQMQRILLTTLTVDGPANVSRTTARGAEGPYYVSKASELAVILREGLIGTGDKNKIQDVAWEFQRRIKNKKAIVPDSLAVINASKVEAAFDQGGEAEVGIGESTPFVLADFLGEIKHRTPQKQNAARKIAMRTLALGYKIAPNTKSAEFKEFRNMTRQLSANLSTSDITQTVRELAKRLYPTAILSDGTRNLLERTAARMGYDADSILEQLVIEDVDMNANRVLMQQIKDQLSSFEGFDLEDAVDEARDAMRDAIAFSVNGLIQDPVARQRFLPLTMYGDMKSGSNLLSRGSPAAVFGNEVPAEFASEYASETVSRLQQNSIDAVKDFTGEDDVKVFFVTSSNVDPIFGNLPEITDRPTNTMVNMRDQMIETAPVARKRVVSELIDQSDAIRNGINGMRTDGSTTDLGDHYTFDNVVGEELTKFGATDLTKAKAVFLRDDKPAVFPHQMTFKSDVVTGIVADIKKTSVSPDKAAQVDMVIEDSVGIFTGRQVFETLSQLAGSSDELRRVMRRSNYSTITVDGQTVLVSPKNIRNVDSPDLVKAKALIGEVEVGSGINNFIMSEARIASDGGETAVKKAAAVLEKAGVPKDFLKASMKIRRRQSINEADVESIRTVLTTDTQSGIIRRSGMDYVAEFAEPIDGSGGHFERIHGRMSRVLAPMTRMLNKLPDSKNPMARWFDAGLRQMFDTTSEAVARRFGDENGNLFGFNPTRAEQQPRSHLRIVTALSNESGVSKLRADERPVYDMVRTYLDEMRGRLAAAGENVGNISENYFPQVWRTDLINARRPEFENMLSEFFVAEDVARNGGNAILKQRDALIRAKRVTKQIVDEDGGVNLPREKVFLQGEGNEDFFKQRMLRIDQFPEFKDPMNQKKYLGGFMENDLMTVMSKYAENAERRLDISENFGPQAHGLRDYAAILRNRHDAVSRLLSTDKILKSDYHILSSGNDADLGGASVLEATANPSVFKAPFPNKAAAENFTDMLVQKAATGSNKDVLTREIMDLLEPSDTSDEFSDQMRTNFVKRAEAIASALTDTKGFTKFPSEKNVTHAEKYIDLLMQKPNGTEAWRKASSALRMVNGVTLLSFTTLTSLGDLVLPLIRSGDFKSWTSALSKYASDPVAGSAYRDMIRNVGVAVENTVHQRMSNSYGVDANRFTTGFFTATGLTPWTDMMREISGATAFEHFKASARIAKESPNTRQGRLAKRALDEYGLQDLYARGAPHIDLIMRSGGTQASHPMYESVQTGMIKFANESIFAPNKNDLPQWATHPGGQLLFQLKSFPLKMLRLGRFALNEAKVNADGDRNLAPLLLYMTAGPAMGFTAANVKDVVQFRGGEENREAQFRERRLSKSFTSLEGTLGDNADKALGWYWDGFMTMGGLGILGELMYDTVNQADNGAYGAVRTFETFGGPTSGLFFDAQTILGGSMSAVGDAISGKGTNGKERAAVREVVSRIPVIGQMGGVREKIVDFTAGEKGARK